MTDPIRTILGLFAKSPFKPLNEHAEKVRLTVWKMNDAVQAYADGNTPGVEALYPEISELEHDADKVKHYIRENLPSSLLMPVDRTDILSYLKKQDEVANSAELVGQLLTVKALKLPQDTKEVVLKLNKEVLKTVEEHVAAAGKITAMLDTAFSAEKINEIQELIDKVDTQKHKADMTRLKAMKVIYAHEKDLGPLGINHLLMIVTEMGMVAEYAESSSDRLRIMAARR